jgi:hypothetical protein
MAKTTKLAKFTKIFRLLKLSKVRRQAWGLYVYLPGYSRYSHVRPRSSVRRPEYPSTRPGGTLGTHAEVFRPPAPAPPAWPEVPEYEYPTGVRWSTAMEYPKGCEGHFGCG